MPENNPTTKELQYVIDKVRQEATRQAYAEGAYDAIMAVFRSLNVPAPHISRPSLWATPINRTRDLREYTDCNGGETLDEMKQVLDTAFGTYKRLSVDEIFENALLSSDAALAMPQSPLDQKAMEGEVE
tara:strand:- start:4427 stop:4813 length:387 start_codon:yes stop_codon:yes gene_type:complete